MLRPLLALAILATTGCTTRLGDLTIASNRNVDLAHVAEARATQNPVMMEGREGRHWLFMMLPVSGTPTVEGAIDAVLDQANADCLIDVSIYSYWWVFPPFYAQTGYEVRGRPINTYMAGR